MDKKNAEIGMRELRERRDNMGELWGGRKTGRDRQTDQGREADRQRGKQTNRDKRQS